MLPKTINCPHCNEELELEESERSLQTINCPACGKDIRSSIVSKSNAQPSQTQYPMLRSYSRGAKVWGYVLAAMLLFLFVKAAIAIPSDYQAGLIVLGIAVAISLSARGRWQLTFRQNAVAARHI
jgi:endogenous inhibitor of DNA gyrase (YacG/DUF329 family)